MARIYSTNGLNRNAYRILVRNPRERGNWEDQNVNRRIILNFIIER
jgi:hypothetical protein